MGRVRKRAFERRNGVLRDAYVGIAGRKVILEMPVSVVGEAVPDGERPSRRAEISSDDGKRARDAMYALSDDHSPEKLEQLLVALSKRNSLAPGSLVAYADDPRVQPAILDAARSVPLEDLANYAQVLGMLGGPGAREVLRARMHEGLADSRTFAPDSFFNWRAGSAVTCAEHLLKLDPEDRDAADALVRLVGHVCAGNRRSAAWRIARLLKRHSGLSTGPLRVLRAKLEELIGTPDDEVFSVAAPALWRDARVPARISRLLDSRSLTKQEMALNALSKVEYDGWPMLIDWGSRPRDPVLVLTTLGPNLRLLPDARRAEIAKHGLAHEAPSIRHEAAALLSSLDAVIATTLARQALRDEPESVIRAKLSSYLKRRPRAKSRTRTSRRRSR